MAVWPKEIEKKTVRNCVSTGAKLKELRNRNMYREPETCKQNVELKGVCAKRLDEEKRQKGT